LKNEEKRTALDECSNGVR